MRKHARQKVYVGHVDGGHVVVFRSSSTPTSTSHGRKFRSVTGPFKTVRGTKVWAAAYNRGEFLTQDWAENRARARRQ